MIKYFVHVIDESSIFIEKDGEYCLENSLSETEEVCEIQKTDCWYAVDAKTPTEAALEVSSKIKILDERNNVINLNLFLSQKNSTESSDVELNSTSFLDIMDCTVSNNTYSDMTTLNFQVNKNEDNEEWIENHKLTFFVVPVEKIIAI